MQDPDDPSSGLGASSWNQPKEGRFRTTHWSVVIQVGDQDPAASAAAMEELCWVYWYPIYWFIRSRRGYSHPDAADLTQSFFHHLLEKETLKKAVLAKGKFRTFLLGVLDKVLANEWDKQRAEKRGGKHQLLSIDAAQAEGLYGCEPVETETPEKAFNRRWAAALLRRVLERLRKEYVEKGKADLFAALEFTLSDGAVEGSYAEVAAQLGMSEGAVRVAAHRLKTRFGELLRNEVAHTVATPQDIDEEIRYLLSAISG